MLICPNSDCRHENPNGSKYCSYCGTKLEGRSVCNNCGKELLPDAKFCPECGTPVSNKRQKTLEEQEKELENIDILLFKHNILDQKECIRGYFTDEDIIQENVDKVFEGYFDYAIKGNGVAENAIGLFYEKGIYVNKDENKALEWYKRSVDHNCCYGYDNLAYLYQNGMGRDKNIDKAICLYQVAANSGYALSQYHLAEIYFYKEEYKDYPKALYWAKKAADQLLLEGILILNEIYEKGFNDPNSFQKTIGLLESLADKNPEIYGEIALRYYEKIEIPNNIEKAISYIKKGHIDEQLPEGKIILGRMYFRSKDFVNSKKCYEEAIACNPENGELYWLLGMTYFELGNESDTSEAIDLFQKALDLRCYKAAEKLGNIYSDGVRVAKDLKKALYYYELSSSKGSDISSYNLGILYLEGEGIEQDVPKAIKYLERSGKQGLGYAYFILGDIYYAKEYGIDRDTGKALEYFKKSFELEYLFAATPICTIYTREEFFNIDEALKYAEMAESKGETTPYYIIGDVYRYGNHCEKNVNKAIECYQKAIKSYNDAYLKLSDIYYFELKDYDNAQKYIDLALKEDPKNPDFILQKGIFYYHGIQKDINLAKECFEKAASLGSHKAFSFLGMLYQLGEGCEKNLDKAMKYYRKASVDESSTPYSLIAGIYNEKGQYGEAIRLYRKDIQENTYSPLAYYNLGCMYFKGEGVEKNYDLARECFEKAIQMNQRQAKTALGIMHYYGYGIKKDKKKARALFEDSIADGCKNGYYGLGLISETENTINGMEDAKRYYSLALNNNYDSPYLALARIYRYNDKDYEKSKSIYLECIKACNCDQAAFELAEMLEYDEQIKNYEEILHFYKKAIEINPNNTDASCSLTRLFATNYQNAIKKDDYLVISKAFSSYSSNTIKQTAFINKINSIHPKKIEE